jgi:hypothetical protein
MRRPHRRQLLRRLVSPCTRSQFGRAIIITMLGSATRSVVREAANTSRGTIIDIGSVGVEGAVTPHQIAAPTERTGEGTQ